jgi:hypothetical protein
LEVGPTRILFRLGTSSIMRADRAFHFMGPVAAATDRE